MANGRGKGGKSQNEMRTRSSRAGLRFPGGRAHRFLKRGNYANTAPIDLAAVTKYLAAVILELAGNTTARDNKKHRITPRHLELVIRNNEELNKLLSSVTIARLSNFRDSYKSCDRKPFPNIQAPRKARSNSSGRAVLPNTQTSKDASKEKNCQFL